MKIDDKKLNVDDITFDDMLDGGIEDVVEETTEEKPEPVDNEEPKAETEETSLEDDVKAKQQEDSDQGQILAEAEIPTLPEGKFTKKSEEVAEEETEGEVDDTVVGQVLSSLGYESEDGAYEDTPEGLANLAKDVGSQVAEEQLDQLFEAFPLVGQHLSYVMNGGNSQDFMTVNDPRSDYSKMRISEKDLRGQKYILSEYMRAKGHDDKFTSELLNDYQEGGKLYGKAKSAQEELIKMQNYAKQQMVEQQQAYQQQQMEEQEESIGNINSPITNMILNTEFASQ